MKKILSLNKKWLIISVLVLLVFVYFIIRNKSTSSKQSYQTEKVSRETVVESVSVSGTILSSSSQIVSTNATGIVKNVFVENGQKVKKGDKILEIDLDQAGQYQYQSALASYLSAKSNLDNAQNTLLTLQADMFDKWEKFYNLATNSTYQNADGTPNETNRQLPEFWISKNNWLAAEAKYKAQQNQINQAQSALTAAWINYQKSSPIVYAPFDGIIADLIYAPGMTISSASNSSTSSTTASVKIATIKNQGVPFGTFTASEIDVSKIKPGQKATITLDALSDKTYTGEVVAVDKTGEVSSSVVSYPLTIKFDDEASEVLPNMSATANIIIAKKIDVLTVPSSAIIKQNGETFVRQIKNGKLVFTPVEVGISSDTKTEVVSGLKEGDEIVTLVVNSAQASTGSNQSPFSSFGVGGQRIRIR
jgi:macrolide-specific efflux system membrane fusion protein